ncbi:MAG: ribosome biogenesis GTP-binding protein YsxC [Halobacteriovoraceae bacterium]|nr:ribosome biogenesis GTP-binding protein YsxC [Halobacteriovoraceae bacterium]
MNFKIAKGRCKFSYGFQSPSQMNDFLINNADAIGVAFVGRSNVGKSSLINTIYGKNLAKTSKTPGRTRQINVFEFFLENEGSIFNTSQKLYLFDLPGYGHAEVSKEMSKQWQQLMDTFFQLISPNLLLVSIQDARHPNQKSDQQFYSYIKKFAHQTSLVFNKMDKLKKQKEKAALKKIKPEIMREFKWVQEIFFLSAEDKQGVPPFEASLVNFINKRLFIEENI